MSIQLFTIDDMELLKNWATITDAQVIYVKDKIINMMRDNFAIELPDEFKCQFIQINQFYQINIIDIDDDHIYNIIFNADDNIGHVELIYKILNDNDTNKYKDAVYDACDSVCFPCWADANTEITVNQEGVYMNGQKTLIKDQYETAIHSYDPLSIESDPNAFMRDRILDDRILLLPEYNKNGLLACVLLRIAFGSNVCCAFIDTSTNTIHKWKSYNHDYPSGMAIKKVNSSGCTDIAVVLSFSYNNKQYASSSNVQLLYKNTSEMWKDLTYDFEFPTYNLKIHEDFEIMFDYITSFTLNQTINKPYREYYDEQITIANNFLNNQEYYKCIDMCQQMANTIKSTYYQNQFKYNLACAYSRLGTPELLEKAMDILVSLEQHLINTMLWHHMIFVDKDMTNLQTHPRFIEYKKKFCEAEDTLYELDN